MDREKLIREDRYNTFKDWKICIYSIDKNHNPKQRIMAFRFFTDAGRYNQAREKSFEFLEGCDLGRKRVCYNLWGRKEPNTSWEKIEVF